MLTNRTLLQFLRHPRATNQLRALSSASIPPFRTHITTSSSPFLSPSSSLPFSSSFSTNSAFFRPSFAYSSSSFSSSSTHLKVLSFSRTFSTSGAKNTSGKDQTPEKEEQEQQQEEKEKEENAEGQSSRFPPPPKRKIPWVIPTIVVAVFAAGGCAYFYDPEYWKSHILSFTNYEPAGPLVQPALPYERGLRLPEYLLVIDLKDIIYYEWNAEKGIYRRKKRPHMEKMFLQLMSHYEILLWNSEEGQAIGMETVFKLDPRQIHQWRLFADSLTIRNYVYYKDLNLLGRPMDKVVAITSYPDEYLGSPDNIIKIKEWKGDDEDETFRDITVALLKIAQKKEDVRQFTKRMKELAPPGDDLYIQKRCHEIRKGKAEKAAKNSKKKA